MAMLCIDPLRVGTNMSFGGQGTIPSQLEIMPSLVHVPLNTLQHQLAHCHHVNSSNKKTLCPCNMK
jgi:hypothetical protein